MTEVIIPILGMDVDASFVQHHCAAAGLNVSSAVRAPQEFSVLVGGERLWNGDRGIAFWLAEINSGGEDAE